MALNITIDAMVANARKCANVEGTSGLQRHPDADVFDYVNRGIAALDRLLRKYDAGQRFITNATFPTVAGTETYALASDFMHLIGISGTFNGTTRWLAQYDMQDRVILTDDAASTPERGAPTHYRLQGANISLMRIPDAVYTLDYWYTAAPSTLTTGQHYDTIARLDDYIIWHAAKDIAKKDQNWDLHDRLSADMAELRGEIEALARTRDHNSPGRILDVNPVDRWGRFGRFARWVK